VTVRWKERERCRTAQLGHCHPSEPHGALAALLKKKIPFAAVRPRRESSRSAQAACSQVSHVQSLQTQEEQGSPPHEAQLHVLWLQVGQLQFVQSHTAQTSLQSAH
jgi:hypothetical protein